MILEKSENTLRNCKSETGNVQKYFLDCGQVTEKSVTDTSVSLNWNCPCQEWVGVDRYEFEFKAEDGQLDFTHTSRTSGMVAKHVYNISLQII